MRLVVGILLLWILAVSSRPVLPSVRPEFSGSPVPDEDGVFRHDSRLHSKDKRMSSPNTNDRYMRYEAKLKTGTFIRNIDSILEIDSIACLGANFSRILLTSFTPSPISSWNPGDILNGAREWGCVKEGTESEAISARILSANRVRLEGHMEIWQVNAEFVPMAELFEYLDLDLAIPSASRSGYDQLPPPRTPVLLEPRNISTQVKRDEGSPYFTTPRQSDMFVDGEYVEVRWSNAASPSWIQLKIAIPNYPDTNVFDSFDVSYASGYFRIPLKVDEYWTVSPAYYVTLAYDCNWLGLHCSEYDSPHFAVRTRPDILFYSPVRGQTFASNSDGLIQFSVNPAVVDISSGINMYVYRQVEYAFDVEILSAGTFYYSNISHQVYWPANVLSSNSYYVSLEYNCFYGYFCDTFSSELFSVVQNPSTISVQWISPKQGSVFLSSNRDNISVSLLATNRTGGYLNLKRQRVGWDDLVYSEYITISEGRNDYSLSVSSSWPQSSNYYFQIQWDCSSGPCAGSSDSKPFSVNYRPDIIFQTIPDIIEEHSTFLLQWTSEKTIPVVTVYLRTDAFPFDGKYCLDSLYNQGNYSWQVENVFDTVLWEYYFELTYDCWVADYGCTSVTSPHFRIPSASLWSWNYANGTTISPSIEWFHSNCSDIKEQCNGSDSEVCSTCDVPGFDSQFSITCEDCFANFEFSINTLSLQYSWATLTAFNANITTTYNSKFTPHITLPSSYETSVDSLLYTQTLFGTPSLSVAGISLQLGLYADVSFRMNFSISGSADVEVTVVSALSNSIIYDLNAGHDFEVLNRTFDVSSASLAAHAVAEVDMALPVAVRLQLLSVKALEVEIAPTITIAVSAQYPAFAPLPTGTVPNENSQYHLGTDACANPHFIELNILGSVPIELSSYWTPNSILFNPLGGSKPIASGCYWESHPRAGKSEPSVTLRFDPTTLRKRLPYTSYVLEILIATDLGAILDIPIEVPYITFNATSSTAVIHFADTPSNSGGTLAASLASLAASPKSSFYDSQRFVSKYATPTRG